MSDNVRGTLLQVTKRKFENLKAEKHRFDEQHEKSLKNAKHQENAVERLNAFIKDIEEMELIDEYDCHPDFKLVKEILRQAQYDTAITEKIIQGWQERLEQRLIQYGRRFDCALLFNDLVMRCVESGTSDSQEDGKKNEKVARKEMYEQRKEWESLAFSQPTIDVQRINSYLEEIFETSDKPEKAGCESSLQKLRNSIKQTCDGFPAFDEFVVKSCIDGILSADLFAGEKRDNLRDLKKHSNILKEIANILNQDLDSLDHWSWADGHVELDMRRHINGKYRVYMDEEIYQAIFLHHIGNEWSKQLLIAFTVFREKVWTFQSESPLDIKSKQKRQDRGCWDKSTNLTVSKHRSQVYKSNYWLLPLKEQNALHGYIDDDDVKSENQAKSSFTDLKQGILRLITAEMQVQNEIYQSFTVWQSDFRWFGPSLPHETIFAVLKFLGMDETWLSFMRKFLTPNVKFKMDGKDGITKKRSNGMPIAHQLCTVFGESIMFVLDYAVNQNTAGGNLYRIHDDLWFWGQQVRCQTAWKTLEKFVDIMGLKLNEEKTAAITVSAPSENRSQRNSLNIDNAELPWGKVRWGFLVLNGEALQWDIDQEQLEKHLEEFQLQLNATSSLIGWIRVWNSYVSSFFANNFGKPAICLGARHVKICMEAFEAVQKKLFGEKGNLATYVGSRIKSENENAQTTDASVYFPKRVGGLEAHNPLIKLSALSAWKETEIQEMLKNAWDNCKNDFDSLKKRWEEKELLQSLSTESHTPRPFLDWEEYTSFLEDTDTNFGWRYERLMEDCSTSSYKLDGIIFEQNHLRGLKKFEEVIDSKRDPYWHRILALYGEEAVDTFGTLALADPDNLPLGVVDYLFSEKVRWQG